MIFDFKINPFTITLTEPLYRVDDYTAVKTETKRVICEIVKHYKEPLYIPYSGGQDSAFLFLCYKDLIKENKLSVDDILIISGQLVPTPPEWTRGNEWIQRQILPDMNYKIIEINPLEEIFLKQVFEIAYQCHGYLDLGELFQTVFMNNLSGLSLVANSDPNRFSKKWLMESTFKRYGYILVNKKAIEVTTWDRHIYSSFFLPFYFDRPFVPYNPDYHYNNEYLWNALHAKASKKLAYIHSFPELFELYPKNSGFISPTKTGMYAVYVNKALQKIFPITNNLGEPIYLPNGEEIISIEQTQEFFK